MAISALSQSRQGSNQNVHSIHYVNQAYSSLQNSLENDTDLLSDKVFLTYFLLLVYEVSIPYHPLCSKWGALLTRFDQMTIPKANMSHLWSHYVSQLLQIYIGRQTNFGGEKFPFIVWWVSNIDLYALLGGIGTGEFVRTVIDHQLYHGLDFLVYPARPEESAFIFPREHDNLPRILRLYHDTFVLLVRLGRFALDSREFKRSCPDSPFDHQQDASVELREEFRRLWAPSEVRWLTEHRDSLPERSQYILQQVR